MRRSLLFSALLILPAAQTVAEQAVMRKDSIACWEHRDFVALALGEYRMNYWGSHQQKRDFMAQGRCFAVRTGEVITVEQLARTPYALVAKVRRPNETRSFWTDRGFRVARP